VVLYLRVCHKQKLCSKIELLLRVLRGAPTPPLYTERSRRNDPRLPFSSS